MEGSGYFIVQQKHILKKIRWLWILCLLLLSACTPLYFQEHRPPLEPFRIQNLENFPHRELWYGFVFNGEKVGFTHQTIRPIPERQLFLITSEAYLRIRFLGMDKRITMISEDTVRPDLTLVSYHYEQQMDGKPLRIDGGVVHGYFWAVQKMGQETKTLEKKLDGPLYPTSVINLYPVLRGIVVGSSYRFTVFDSQTQSFEEVSQSVVAFEESKKLALEPSFKIDTHLHGHTVSTWITPRGETLLEFAMGGVLITYREDETQARQFLSEASLNKKDLILDFSLVKTEKALPCPRETSFLEIVLDGISGNLPLLQGPGQEASEHQLNGKTMVVYRIHTGDASPEMSPKPSLDSVNRRLYLAATHHLESDHPEIIKIASAVTSGAVTPREKVKRLTGWVAREVKDEYVDSFSALEVLHTRKGECQAHTLLYTAMARAVGIPTKLVAGLVYMEGLGFLYHSWAESYADGWVTVDPTFNQVGVDATHIKLVEGPSWTSTLSVGTVVGKIKARITDNRNSCKR